MLVGFEFGAAIGELGNGRLVWSWEIDFRFGDFRRADSQYRVLFKMLNGFMNRRVVEVRFYFPLSNHFTSYI